MGEGAREKRPLQSEPDREVRSWIGSKIGASSAEGCDSHSELVCADMKAARAKTVDVDAVDDIVETLNRVSRARLGVVR